MPSVSSIVSLSRTPAVAPALAPRSLRRVARASCRPGLMPPGIRAWYSAASSVEQLLAPSRLSEVRDLWFEHLGHGDSVVLPRQDDSRRWFMDSELDRACVERFAPTLEAMQQSGLGSGADVMEAAKPREPGDWLGLVILLDQVPRNCYRGDEAAVAFTVFDPMARHVALAAMERGIPDEEPQMRWQFAYRQWYYLPLMHSEDLALHRRAMQAYERMRRDVHALAGADEGVAARDGGGGGGHHRPRHGGGGCRPRLGDGGCRPRLGDGGEHYRARAAAVMRANADEARRFGDLGLEFERRHMAVIERFGRYPHRNKALGRTSTAEETEYLETGGETFGR